MSRFDRLDGVALISGFGLPLAFAPFGWALFAMLSPAGLLFSIKHAGPGRAAFRGWLFGVGSFGLGVSWVVASFQHSHIALPLAIVLMVLGGVITAGMIWFNIQREALMQRIRIIRADLAQWE